MKKLLLSAIFAFSAVTTYAQVPRGFSVAAGLNSATLNSSDLKADGGLGFQAGLGFNWGYHETYNYQIDLLYSRNNFELPYANTTDLTTGTQKYGVENFDILLHFNYYLLRPDEDKFYGGLQAGGFLQVSSGQWVPAKKADVTGQVYQDGLTESSFQDVNQLNYGASFGIIAGYNKFRASLKYNLGLSNALEGLKNQDINPSNGQYEGKNYEGKLSAITFTLYYQIF